MRQLVDTPNPYVLPIEISLPTKALFFLVLAIVTACHTGSPAMKSLNSSKRSFETAQAYWKAIEFMIKEVNVPRRGHSGLSFHARMPY